MIEKAAYHMPPVSLSVEQQTWKVVVVVLVLFPNRVPSLPDVNVIDVVRQVKRARRSPNLRASPTCRRHRRTL